MYIIINKIIYIYIYIYISGGSHFHGLLLKVTNSYISIDEGHKFDSAHVHHTKFKSLNYGIATA